MKDLKFIGGLRDHTVVTVEDYEHDTRELAEQGANAAKMLRAKLNDREDLIWAIVRAVGGRVSIPRDLLHTFDRGELTMERCEADDTLRITASE